MSAEGEALELWRAHLAELGAGLEGAGDSEVETDAASGTSPAESMPSISARPPTLPPLPAELAAAASDMLARLRTRIAATRTERDRIGRELDQLAPPPRAQVESRPVYLDTVG